jgi:hypothetical protein
LQRTISSSLENAKAAQKLPVNVVLDKNTKSIESVDTDQFKVKSPF